MRQLGRIFLVFFRTGMFSYGGGPSAIPLIHQDVVKRYHWMDDQTFTDILAMGNALPGPIATKLAGYIGYRVGGLVGCISGLLAMVLPTVLLMIGVLHFLGSSYLQGITKAISPVIAVMLAVLAYTFLRNSWSLLSNWFSIMVISISFLLVFYLKIHPAIPIALLIALSFLPASQHLLKEKNK